MSRHQNSTSIVFGLKYRILALLVFLSMTGLGIFLWLSLSHFSADKRNYLLESSTQVTHTEAEGIRKEIGSAINFIQILTNEYHPTDLTFSSQAQNLFEKQSEIIKIQLLEFQGATKRTGFLLNKNSEGFNLDRLPFNQVTAVNKPFFVCSDKDPTHFVAIIRINPTRYQYAVADIKVSSLSHLMDRKSFQFALLCPDYEPSYIALSAEAPPLNWKALSKELLSSAPYTKEMNLNGTDYLLSSSGVSGTSLQLLNFVDNKKAMATIKKMQLQALWIFVCIVSLTAIIALILSGKITAALESLTTATHKIANGDFNITLQAQGSDEVSILGRSFITMRTKILELLEKTKHTARMEAELETANLVQSTLFPEKEFVSSQVSLLGDYQTASECGGDMWDYFETPQYLFLFIGDVVGHGVPSALMTTAARSVTAILKIQHETSPAKILKLLNHSIYETSKGKMWMTFFVGRYDKQTGEMLYASASHNPPFLFPNKEAIKKADVATIGDNPGPSLGRLPDATYSESQIQIGAGDLVFFYTDGLTECENKDKELMGEARFVRQIVKHWNTEKDIRTFVKTVQDTMESHRGQHPFADDVTYFALKRHL